MDAPREFICGILHSHMTENVGFYYMVYCNLKGLLTYQINQINKFVGVVILDCEGIDDPNQQVPWATKIFILCLAISSTFIFNISGVIGRDDIGKLCLMTDIASHIQPPSDSKFSPNLVVLLRDFQFDNPPNFVNYFLDNLSKVNDGGKDPSTIYDI